MERSIQAVYETRPTIEGAGVHLRRGFGYSETPAFDPFLLFDDFSSIHTEDFLPGFPEHPHRGIETVTYILEGEVRHRDSMGNQGSIGPGDVQWMTAGSGIIHEEMPQRAQGVIKGFQLWVNLPANQKMMSPRYQDIRASQIPVVQDENGNVRVIAGTYRDTNGPIADLMVRPTYLDIFLHAGKPFVFDVVSTDTAFVYVFEGAVSVGAQTLTAGMIGLLTEGERVVITTQGAAARCLLVAGAPLKEPIAWYGPVVMNTEEELRMAFVEYRGGSFIKENATPRS